ncbi:hypothetical protein RND81_04G235700 [Saponaria officinalis]|uniref:F-box domain-containing protein n=1 Tax=Saponaria officinalis TaxID=3572 RepID=A0AAW1LP67_SAPOF
MTVTEMAGVVRVRSHQSNSNNSRHFSRLIKSCCPNPDAPSHSFSPFNPIVVVKPKFPTIRKTSICCLPDDILYDILSRVPLSSLPSISAVCRRWARLVDADTFSLLRRMHARLHPTLFVFSLVNTTSFSTLRLFVDDSWNVSRNDVVPFRLPSDVHADISHARVTAVGRKVFIVSRFNCLCFDPWTGMVKPRSEPVWPRKRFAIAAVNGRVYVAGGSPHASEVEEFNPDTNEWRVVSDAPRRRYGCVGVGVESVFYIIGGLKIGGASDTRAAEARAFASSMDLYDVASRGWLKTRSVPGGGCVVAACGAHGHVYVLASHAVELSFWRFNATRNGSSGSGTFGEWCRMRPPPMPAQVRVGGGVKYSSVGVEEKVVLIQVNKIQANVFIFDCVTQEWSSAPNLPHFVQRVATICVDC